MKWNVGDRVCGFSVTRVRESAKAGGTLYEMKHEKTGAELCWMDSGAENKLFSIAFKTIPENDTGVFHILEHSVLCGSEKYPVKEPFLELLKGSMNTFLNAMTYPDKTVYPVSSRCEADFLNLTGVYLDAVFSPLLLKNKSIFYQEGRHLETGEDGASFNGVVLNEMKGAMSGVDDRIETYMQSLLFPDNCYRFNSGGDPGSIPTLDYEGFTAAYRRFYHPSNARIFLDGDLPLEKTLTMIDGYLSRYDRADIDTEIPWQEQTETVRTDYYPSDTSDAGKDYIAWGKLFGRYDDLEKILAVRVLCSYLASTNASPLKAAILDAKLAEDMDLFENDGIRQPYLMMVMRNTSLNREEQIKKTVNETIGKILSDGIPKQELTAALNKIEFGFRQMPEPQGLYRALFSLSSWLYGGDPLQYLDTDEVFRNLRRMIETDAYEKLLRELFPAQGGFAALRLLPSVTLAAEEDAALRDAASARYSAMTKEERETLEAETEALNRFREAPDSEEALATIPKLPLSEVSPDPKRFITDERTAAGCKVLFHPAATNGVIHYSLYLPMTEFSLQELSLLSLLPELYTELPTAEKDVTTLQREIKTYIGACGFDLSVTQKCGQNETCTPRLVVHISVLRENAKTAQKLLAEILTQTDFTDRERVRAIVKQIDEDNKQSLIGAGHAVGVLAVRAGYSAAGAVREALNGFTAMRTVRRLADDFDREYDKFLSLVDRVQKRVIGKRNAVVGITSDADASCETLLGLLPQGVELPAQASYQTELPHKMGVRIPSQISFAVKGYHSLSEAESDGRFRVAANILSLSYLWNRIRVQGGAYGTGFAAGNDDGFFCYSYRDPSPAQSLAVYDDAAVFIEDYCNSDEEIDSYVISTVSGGDPLQTPQAEGLSADALYFTGRTYEMRKALRTQMLSATKESLLSYTEPLRQMAHDGSVCVVGGEEALAACPDLEILEL